MNELMIFNNPEFGEIRTVEVNGEPWFVGKDVAAALGYSDTSDALKKHVDPEDKLTRRFADSGQSRKMYIVNESGLYSLVLSSKLPGAKKFKRWVTSEVLPAIRKTGRYEGRPMTDYQQMLVDTRRQNIAVQKARLLNQMAAEYEGTYHQVLQAYATRELTGEFLLPLPSLPDRTYTAEEIGVELGISANMVGRLANAHGLKTEQYGSWFVDKAKNANKEVSTFRYFHSVVPAISAILADGAS